MIIFEFSDDLGKFGCVLYWIGMTSITKEDREHSDEIYEQIAAHESHLDEGV